MKTIIKSLFYFVLFLIFFISSQVNTKEQCLDTILSNLSKSLELNKTRNSTVCSSQKNTEAILSRKRRALLLPDGTRLLITASLVKAILVGIPLGWNVALELDVFYDLHKKSHILNKTIKYFNFYHRQRRDVWDHMEGVLDLYGVEGQSCVLRAICEAQQYLAPKDVSLVHDILKTIFSAPEEEGPHDDYTKAHKTKDCKDFHSKCPISVLEALLSYVRV